MGLKITNVQIVKLWVALKCFKLTELLIFMYGVVVGLLFLLLNNESGLWVLKVDNLHWFVKSNTCQYSEIGAGEMI